MAGNNCTEIFSDRRDIPRAECRMNQKHIVETIEVLLFVCLIGALVLSAFVFFFVFCVDWVDWFFGIKLEGLPAGIYLFAKMAGAVAIIYLMVHYPRYRRQSVLLVFLYYGMLCFDAVVTLWKNPQSDRDYPLMMLVLFSITVLLLVVHGTLSLTQPEGSCETKS
jgi:hypothetical protein